MMKPVTLRSWLLPIAIGAFLAVGCVFAVWESRRVSAEVPLVAEKLRIGVADAFVTIPVLVGEDQGFYREAGLDLTYRHFPSGKAAMDTMLEDGSLDIVTVSDPPIVLAALRKRDVVWIGGFTRAATDTKTIAHPESGIKTVADLRGKRIGVPPGTIADYCLHVLLTDASLAMKDVVKVPLAGAELAAGLGQRQVDAVATYEPYGMQAGAAVHNQGAVFNNPGRCVVTTGFITPRALPKQRTEAVARLLRGTERSIEWIKTHRSEAIAIIVRRLNVDTQLATALWDSYDFSLTLNQPFLNSLDAHAKWAVEVGMVPPTPLPNFLDYIDYAALDVVKPGSVTIIR